MLGPILPISLEGILEYVTIGAILRLEKKMKKQI